jgi:hypothetical protein
MGHIRAAFIAAAMCLALAGTAAALDCIKSERWDVKTLADKDARRIDFTPRRLSVREMIRIKTLIPSPLLDAPRQPMERRVYETTCIIKSYSVAIDGDLNLVLADPEHPDDTLIAEAPDPDCPNVKTSPYAGEFRRVRKEFMENCLGGGRILKSGWHPVKKVLYKVTGVVFIDIPHFMKGKAPNNIELHPILSISRIEPQTPRANILLK